MMLQPWSNADAGIASPAQRPAVYAVSTSLSRTRPCKRFRSPEPILRVADGFIFRCTAAAAPRHSENGCSQAWGSIAIPGAGSVSRATYDACSDRWLHTGVKKAVTEVEKIRRVDVILPFQTSRMNEGSRTFLAVKLDGKQSGKQRAGVGNN